MAPENTSRTGRRGPLGGAQEFEWWKLLHGTSTNVTIFVEPADGTTCEAAKSLLHAALDPYESLRTSFGFDQDGQPHQVVHPVSEFEISEWNVEKGDSQEFVENLENTVFTVDDRALVRMGAVRNGAWIQRIVIVISHAVIDGRSAQILRQELNSAFAGEGQPRSVTAAGPQPIDSAVSEKSGALARVRNAAMRFWEKEIPQLPNRLFAARPSGIIERYHSEYESYAANPALLLAARRFQTSPAVVYTSSVVAIAGLISGTDTVTVRTHLAGRSPEESNSVGCYHQILPLTVSVHDRPDFAQIIERVKAKAFRIQGRYRVGHLRLRELMAREEFTRGTSFAEGITVNFDHSVPLQELKSDESRLMEDLRSSRECELLMGSGESGNDPTGLDAYLLVRLRRQTLHAYGTFNAATLSTEQMRCFLAGPEQLVTRLLADEDLAWDAMQRIFGTRICAEPDPDIIRRGSDVLSISETTAALQSHPDVVGVSLRVCNESGSPLLVAHVTARVPHTSTEALRSHVLEQISPAHSIVCPDQFVVSPAEAPESVRPLDVKPSQSLVDLCRVIAQYHDIKSLDHGLSYLSVGGELQLAPAIARELVGLGYSNVSPQDFTRPIVISSLAAWMRRHD